MKDDLYFNLLKEVKERVFSVIETSQDAMLGFAQLETEMGKVKEILISSGHDLKTVEEFNLDVQMDIFLSLAR